MKLRGIKEGTSVLVDGKDACTFVQHVVMGGGYALVRRASGALAYVRAKRVTRQKAGGEVRR